MPTPPNKVAQPNKVVTRRMASRVAAVGVTVLAAAAMVACSSSGSKPSSGASSTDSTPVAPTTTASAASSIPAPATTPPTGIGITQPLNDAPAKSVVVGALTCSLPSCTPVTKGFKDATAALGWTLKQFPYQQSSLASVQSALQQAINAKVAYIFIYGYPTAAYKQQLAAAKAANIPVIAAGAVGPADTADGSPTNFANNAMFKAEGVNMEQWMLRDGGGSNVHVAEVTLPDFAILNGLTAGLQQAQQQYCLTGCSVDNLPVTSGDLGSGAIPAKVVAFLQSHPDVNYLSFAFSDLYPGVYSALKQAGLTSKVKIVGFSLSAPTVVAFQSGQVVAWDVFSLEFESWLQVDAAARLSEGMAIPDSVAPLPNYIATNAQAAAATGSFWPGPAGFQAAFKQLWHVS
jgi:ABC-type sugar transport system substrate-binding protein